MRPALLGGVENGRGEDFGAWAGWTNRIKPRLAAPVGVAGRSSICPFLVVLFVSLSSAERCWRGWLFPDKDRARRRLSKVVPLDPGGSDRRPGNKAAWATSIGRGQDVGIGMGCGAAVPGPPSGICC